jgi:glycosyltransferase involved in cell wall biosynthesis
LLVREYRLLEQKILARAHRVVVASPQLRQAPPLANHLSKLVEVPFGVDLERFRSEVPSQLKSYWRGKLRSPLVLAVGRLVYYKGFDVLIDAVAATPASLAVVGSGPLYDSLRKRIAILGLENRIHLLGDVSEDDLTALFQIASLFCLPSVAKSEAFGIVQVEAMAAGLPIVNTNLGTGVNFVSPDGETGITVPPGNVPRLVEAIQRLLGCQPLRLQLGQAGRARAERLFSSEAMTTSMLAVYRDALSIAAIDQ